MSDSGLLRRLLRHPWLLVLFATVIGLVSALALWIVIQDAYWDYWFLPKEKAIDGYDTYPEVRSWIFDSGLLLWSLDGLLACGLSLRCAISSREVGGWTYRTIILYFALLVLLIAGGCVMLYVRGRGY